MTSLRNMWMAFRLGHGTYLSLVLQMGNFVIIAYALFLQRIGTDINIFEFVVLFSAVYIPTSIILGRMHIKHQYDIENKASFENNTALARVLYFMVRQQEGLATTEEKNEMKTYLRKIARIEFDEQKELAKL